jgi:hypothetical protein
MTTARDVFSALAGRHRHTALMALNLEHIDGRVIDGTLQALCEALPSLQELRLPTSSRMSLTRVAAATSSLTVLTALHLPSPYAAEFPYAEITGRLSRLRALSLPAGYMEAPTTGLRMCTQVTRLCFHADRGGQGRVDMSGLVRWAAQLPALASLEFDAITYTHMLNATQVEALTALRTLKLCCVQPAGGTTTSEMLRRIGSLTALRVLHLRVTHWGWTPIEQGWLSRLSLLTSLHVAYAFSAFEDEYYYNEDDVPAPAEALTAAFDEVASAVPSLPSLVELSICDALCTTCSDVPSAAACARITSAAGTLRALHLHGLPLPQAAMLVLLPQLTGLTCLRLTCCEGLGGAPGSLALATLTSLRELCYQGGVDECAPPCALLAGLRSIRALSVQAVDGPYLAQLCAAMPQLTCLDLGTHYGAEGGSGLLAAGAPALQPLQLLSRLEVLDLTSSVAAEQLRYMEGVRCLQRCYMGGQCTPGFQKRSMAALGRRMDVVFHSRQRWWW